MLKILFSLSVVQNNIVQDEYINEYLTREEVEPYFEFGLCGSFSESDNLKINVKDASKSKFELEGELHDEYTKMPYDASIISKLFIINTTDVNLIALTNAGTVYTPIKDLKKDGKVTLKYINQRNELECTVVMKVESIEMDFEVEEKQKDVYYKFESTNKKIEKFTISEVIAWNKSDDHLKLQFYDNTFDIFIKCAVTNYPHNPLVSYVTFRDGDSNEECWLNILKYVGVINMIENKFEKLKEHENSTIYNLIHAYFQSLDQKEQMGFSVDLFTLMASNLIYNYDNVIHIKNRRKELIDTFDDAAERGADDCEGFGRYMMRCYHEFSKTVFQNKTLNAIKKLLNNYIACLVNCGVKAAKMGIDEDEDNVGSHMNMGFLSKKWIFEGEKNEKQFGKIIIDVTKVSKEEVEQLKKIYEYEKEMDHLNGETPFFPAEGTGFFNATDKSNNRQHLYDEFNIRTSKYEKSKGRLRKRMFQPSSKKMFFLYFFVITFNYFNLHKHACSYCSFTFTYSLEVNDEKLPESSTKHYIRGVHYRDMMQYCKDVLLLPVPKTQDLKLLNQIVKTIARLNLKGVPLALENGKPKKLYKENNKNYIPPTPNISDKVFEKLKVRIKNKGFTLNSGTYKEIYDVLKEEDVLYIMVSSSCMDETLEDIKSIQENENMTLLYLEKIDLTTVCSFFLCCFKILMNEDTNILESRKLTTEKNKKK